MCDACAGAQLLYPCQASTRANPVVRGKFSLPDCQTREALLLAINHDQHSPANDVKTQEGDSPPPHDDARTKEGTQLSPVQLNHASDTGHPHATGQLGNLTPADTGHNHHRPRQQR